MSEDYKIVKVIPLPHARSEVWQYFGFVADDDGEIKDKRKAVCKLCATTLAYSGNTTNLFTHLKAMHPEAQAVKLAPTNKTPRTGRKSGKRHYIEFDDGTYDGNSPATIGTGNNQPTYIIRAITYSGNESGSSTTSLFDNVADCHPTSGADGDGAANTASSSVISLSQPKLSDSSAVVMSSNDMGASSSTAPTINGSEAHLVNCDDVTNALVNMLVEDCRPLCLTQAKGFQALIRLLAPNYQIPSPEELKPLIKRRHKEIQRDYILRGLEEEHDVYG